MQISLFDSPQLVSDGIANAERAQSIGLHRYWVPQVMNADTMLTLAAVAAAGVWIYPDEEPSSGPGG